MYIFMYVCILGGIKALNLYCIEQYTFEVGV